MRLITYQANAAFRAAFDIDGLALDVEAVATDAGHPDARGFSSTRTLLQSAPADRQMLFEHATRWAARAPDTAVGPVGALVLGPPIVDPEKIICLGANYLDHAREAGMELPEAPMLFAKFRNALIGPGASIVLPPHSDQVDYEAELAIVIGRRCKGVSETDALSYVAGAMPFNDVSARDLQKQTSQWLAGKAIDTFAPCGPALVTIDEIGDVQALDISLTVNGRELQRSNTSQMIFSVAETIEFVSRLITLEPGDIIATGTPAGVGISRTPPTLLAAGDDVAITIESLGTLANPVAAAFEPADTTLSRS